MAKRKRKMTLFDVINTGQPIGLQVRQRVPTYQPTPELPVKKKFAKWFGRKPSNGVDPNRPLSAAEQLEQLRRELKPAEPVEEPKPRRRYQPEPEPEPVYESRAESQVQSTRSRVAELAARAEEAEQAEAPPRKPRKPFGAMVRDRWELVRPKLAVVATKVGTATRAASHRGVEASKFAWGRVREAGGKYGVTALSAAGVIVILGGAFYAGKVLLTRPAIQIPGGELADGTLRPDVMNLDSGASAKANEPIANVSSRLPEATLERKPTDAPTGPFGGRRLDLNYVIVQTYYSRAQADAAVEVLARYDIRTTVEADLPRWSVANKTTFCVVSAESFPKLTGTGSDVYQRYLSTIAKISEREAGKTLPGKLDPRPYRYEPAQPK